MKRFLMMLSGILLLTGCSYIEEYLPGASDVPEVRPTPGYLDFKDILLPGELEKIATETYITASGGRLMLSGRVDGQSVARFFESTMPDNGWMFVNRCSYQGNIKLFFRNAKAVATILISENPVNTRVEIWSVSHVQN